MIEFQKEFYPLSLQNDLNHRTNKKYKKLFVPQNGVYTLRNRYNHSLIASFANLLILFLRSFGMGIRIAGQSLVAHAVGSKDFEKASVVSAQMIILLFAYSVTLSLFGFFLTPFIISIMNLDTEVTGFALDYMKSGFISLFIVFWLPDLSSIVL